MAEHADKTQDRKSQAAGHKTAQPLGGSGLGFGFVDKRPVGVMQRKLQEVADGRWQVKQMAQLQPIHDDHLKKITQESKVTVIQKFSLIDRAQFRGFEIKDCRFEKNTGILYPANDGDLLIAENIKHQPTMIAALQYAASRFSTIGNIANKIKLADGGMSNAPNRNANSMYPFVFEISIPFGPKEDYKTLTLKYQYANNVPGYIISQEVTGEGVSTMAPAHNLNTAPGYANTYSSSHDSNKNQKKLSDLIEQDPLLPENVNAERLDARTKLAAEGARFNVVKDNMSTIKNDTIIYTEENGKVYYLNFNYLWNNWAFLNSDYGITNQKLAVWLKGGLANPNYQIQNTNEKKFKLLTGDKIKV